MPNSAGLGGSRHVRRLADGVARTRLVESILASRPSTVVLCAPSGYGKTVLAAQIATAPTFSSALWVDAGGDSGSIRECLVALGAALTPERRLAETSNVDELVNVCAAEMAALRDAESLAIVVDDVGVWGAGDIRLLFQVTAEAPLGSIVVLTTRGELDPGALPCSVWRLGSHDLQLSDAELEGLLESVGLASVNGPMIEELAGASGRHAALATLIVRQCALSGSLPCDFRVEGGVGAAIVRLAQQLDDRQFDALCAAATLTEASLACLSQCLASTSSATDIAAVSTVLPLVAVSGLGPEARFSVHALVDEALDCTGQLARRHPEVLTRVVRSLTRAGQYVRAADIARRGGQMDLFCDVLASITDPVVIESHAAWLRKALEGLPPATMAGDPSLLLLAAQLQWEAYEPIDAIRTAVLAQQLALHTEERQTATRAQTLVLRMKAATGELEGMTVEVRRMLDEYRPYLDAESLALTAFAGIMAFGLMGDRDGLAECLEIERRLRRSVDVSPLTRFRMSIAQGVVLAIAEGAWPESAEAFLRAVGQPLCLENTAAIANQNRSVALFEMGRLEEALAAVGIASSPTDGRPSGVDTLAALVSACAGVASGQSVDLRSAIEGAYEEAACVGDWLSAATALQFAVPMAVLAEEVGYARSVAERSVDCAMRTGSPLLLWRSQILQAKTLLAAGEIKRAKQVAESLLPQAGVVQAQGHLIHASLILAVIAMRSGDLSGAVERVSAVADTIASSLPIMTLTSYIGAFPELMAPLTLGMGVGRLPAALFPLLRGARGDLALEQASAVLSPKEHELLANRMRATDSATAEVSNADADAVCNVRLFGGLEVITPRGMVGDRDWAKRKARLLFAMLVSRFGTDVPRGEIIEYLWPDMDEERALNNFYVVWSAMKRAISPESVRDTPCPFVEHVRGVCRVVKGRVLSDLEEFTDLLAASREARRMGDLAAELAALRRIAEIYRGEVLPGDVYDDWFAPLRDRFRHDFEDAMLRASSILEEQGDPHGGLQLLRRAMAADPWREDLYQAQLRLQIAAGQRSAAIETYMACRSRLTADLGIDPSRETTALYEQVLGMEEPEGMSRV